VFNYSQGHSPKEELEGTAEIKTEVFKHKLYVRNAKNVGLAVP